MYGNKRQVPIRHMQGWNPIHKVKKVADAVAGAMVGTCPDSPGCPGFLKPRAGANQMHPKPRKAATIDPYRRPR